MTRRYQLVMIVLAAGAFALSNAVPWHESAAIRKSAGLVAATLILWISEAAPLGVTALVVPILATFAGLLTWRDALAAWGDPVVFLFLGTFLLARALEKHGAFDWLMSGRALAGARSARGLAIGVLLLSGAISVAQNNTAVCAMLLPIVTTLARRTAAPAAALLALAWGSTFGGMATPVGTAPNFIGYAAMKKISDDVSFLSWMKVGVPVWLGATLIGWAVLAFVRRRGSPGAISPLVVTDVGPVLDHAARGEAPAWQAGARRLALRAFAVAALVWLVSGVIISLTRETDPINAWVKAYLPESLVPMGVAWALFLLRPAPDAPAVLDRHDFQALDWDTLFLIAGGLCLGRVLESSGAAEALAGAVSDTSLSPAVLMLLVAGATVLLSELTSNTATASLMVPVAGSLGAAMHLSPVQATWLVALSASLGFVLPVSTPPNALVYGTRLVPLRTMIFTGLAVDALCTIWLVCCIRWFA